MTGRDQIRTIAGGVVAFACGFEVVALASRRRLPTVSRILRYSAAASGFVAGGLFWEWLRPD